MVFFFTLDYSSNGLVIHINKSYPKNLYRSYVCAFVYHLASTNCEFILRVKQVVYSLYLHKPQ